MGIRNHGAKNGNPFNFQPKVPPSPLPSRFVWSYPLGSPEGHEAMAKAQRTFPQGDIRAFSKPGTSGEKGTDHTIVRCEDEGGPACSEGVRQLTGLP